MGNVSAEAGNPGMENRKTVILQSHVDMVHQKNNETAFDFDIEGIRMAPKETGSRPKARRGGQRPRRGHHARR